MDIASHLHYDFDDPVVSTLYLKLLMQIVEQHFPDATDEQTLTRLNSALNAPSNKRISFRTLSNGFLTLLTPKTAGVGFRYGEKLNLIAADSLGQLVMSCSTAKESVAVIKHFRLLLGIPFDFDLEYPYPAKPGSAHVAFHALYNKHYPESLNWFISEALFSVIQQQARWLTGNALRFECLYFPYPKPSHYEQYQRYFECPCIFGAKTHAAEFAAEIMTLPILTANEVLKTDKLTLCEQALESIEKRFHPMQRLQVLFKRRFPAIPCIDEAAQELGMSRSALHRKLQDENTSYQCLLNDYKRRKSEQLLTQTNHTISEIAEQIGFSDSSTFRRAFKAWTGLQPSQLRSGSSTSRAPESEPS